MRLNDVLDGFTEIIEASDHAEFFWFPNTSWTLVKRNTRLSPAEDLDPLGRIRGWFEDEFLLAPSRAP